MDSKNQKTETQIFHVSGKRSREVVTIRDEAGNIIEKITSPLMVMFQPHDIVQVLVGASLLAIPMAYTEETWRLGETLSTLNIVILGMLTFVSIALFVYYNVYQNYLRDHLWEFIKRVFGTYIITLLVVALFLALIEQAPFFSDFFLALRRTIVVSVPASMSAAVADMVK